MTEEQDQSVDTQAVAAPVTENALGESKSQSSKEINFAKLRESNESKDREIDSYRERVRQLEAEKYGKNEELEADDAEDDDPLADLNPDDIITAEEVATMLKRQEERSDKKAKKLFKQALKERDYKALPAKTRKKYSADYDSVMTPENIETLEKLEPEIAAVAAKAPNPWAYTYKMVKKFVKTPDQIADNKTAERTTQNLSKPVSLNSIGKAPLNSASVFGKMTKQELYAEMIAKAKMAPL